MQCCIFKLYGLLLNERLYSFIESENKLHEAQNGFRRGRGCVDHIYTLTEAIKLNLPLATSRVFSCFVDIKKAFPSVHRELLLWRLRNAGVHGRIYTAIKVSFRSPLCRLKLPIGNSEYFPNNYGTLEGSPNSPLNFNLFLNELLIALTDSKLGIFYGSGEDSRIPVLAYANDLVLVASSAEDLQKLLDILFQFCTKWRLNVNTQKTKSMLFRRSAQCRKTLVKVHYGGQEIEQVDSYKYLGIVLDAVLNFNKCYEELGASSSRALGAVLRKCRDLRNIGFKTYDNLIQGCVMSIIDYGAEITGFRSHQALDEVVNRAARYFMGVNKFCPLPCLNLEMGWLTNYRRRHLCLFRYYNKLLAMEDDRVPKIIFMNTKNNEGSWAKKLKLIMDELYLGHYWDTDSQIPMDIVKLMIREKCKDELFKAVDERTKLRTYKTLISGLMPASHLKCSLDRKYRSLISQLRCGTLHLRLETGRFNREPLENCICNLCDLDQIETEYHFIFECPVYERERADFLNTLNLDGSSVGLRDLFKHPFQTGKYVWKIWMKRACHLLN